MGPAQFAPVDSIADGLAWQIAGFALGQLCESRLVSVIGTPFGLRFLDEAQKRACAIAVLDMQLLARWEGLRPVIGRFRHPNREYIAITAIGERAQLEKGVLHSRREGLLFGENVDTEFLKLARDLWSVSVFQCGLAANLDTRTNRMFRSVLGV